MSEAEWMKACLDCIRLLRAYDVARTPADCYDTRRAVTAHLATVHRDRLPAPVRCVKCGDFSRVIALPSSLVTPIIRQVLKSAYDEHRAEHLIALSPEIYRRTV